VPQDSEIFEGEDLWPVGDPCALEFGRASSEPTSTGIRTSTAYIDLTLAGTSVGRGWDSVGDAPAFTRIASRSGRGRGDSRRAIRSSAQNGEHLRWRRWRKCSRGLLESTVCGTDEHELA
jgi:hypothetical protein